MIENTGARASDPKYTKDVIDNIRKVVGDIFAAEISEANKEFIKASREQGISMKQVTKDSFQVYMDSKKELDAVLQNQEQLIELYETSEEIRNRVNEITPSKPLPDIKNEEILKSIEERVNFMNELIELAEYYVETYTTNGGKEISMIKGRESIDKLIMVREMITKNDDYETESFDNAKDVLAKLINELKVFKELSLGNKTETTPNPVENIVPPEPTVEPQVDIPSEEKPKRKPRKKKKDIEEEKSGQPSMFEKFVSSFLGWIQFDKKRNWVLELIRWKKNEEKQEDLEEKPDLAARLSKGIIKSVVGFNNTIFDDILSVPDFVLNVIMGAKSAVVGFISGLIGKGLGLILPKLLRLVFKGGLLGGFLSGAGMILMSDSVKNFAVDFIKKFLGENTLTNALISSINENTLQMGLTGAGIGLMLGGPIGALVGFLVGSIGNYVYTHWDDVVKGFGELNNRFSKDNFEKRRNETIAEIEKNKKELEDLYSKRALKEKELIEAFKKNDLMLVDKNQLELSIINEKIGIIEQSNVNLEKSKELETLRESIAKNETTLGNMWLWIDWASFGLLSNILSSWIDFKEYVNKEFTPEKIKEKLTNAFDDLINSITDAFQKYIQSMLDWVYNKLGLQTDEEKRQIESGDKKAIESLRKLDIQNQEITTFTNMYSRNPIKPEIKVIDTKKLEEDIIKLNNNKMGASVNPQSTTITNVMSNSTSISNRASPIDPSRYYWTGGGF